MIAAALAFTNQTASAQLWQDVTAETIGDTVDWTSKLELADINGDGRVDILFANGGDYSTPGDEITNCAFLNNGPDQPFTDVSAEVFGRTPDLSRVIKARDVNADGMVDIIVGGAYQTQTRLYLGTGGGAFNEVTDTNLPVRAASVGDLEIGDVNRDGHLDIVLADWGPGDPFRTEGAPMILWLGDGTGAFVDASDKLPAKKIAWSWDFELLDIDNDFDLDMVISCKVCEGGSLFHNDGSGNFRDATDKLPQFTNNYEFEPIDLNGDGFLDLVTINDGVRVNPNNEFDNRERVFISDRNGGFTDATLDLWPDSENLGADDNAVVGLDVDSDGDTDFIVGSLSGTDRLLRNDGEGNLTVDENVFGGSPTPGTLGIAVADLNGDGKLDVVQSQGELADDERVYYGDEIAPDTAAPRIGAVRAASIDEGEARIDVRIHDGKTPVAAFDFTELVAETPAGEVPLRWVGGQLFTATAPIAVGETFRVCATDAAGNRECSSDTELEDKSDALDGNDSGGCSSAPDGSGLPLALFGLAMLGFVVRRRSGRPAAATTRG